jgi:hypothetical protein
MTDDMVPVNSTKVGYLLKPNGESSSLDLVGYIGKQPVYKTTSTLAMGKQMNILEFINFDKLIMCFI